MGFSKASHNPLPYFSFHKAVNPLTFLSVWTLGGVCRGGTRTASCSAASRRASRGSGCPGWWSSCARCSPSGRCSTASPSPTTPKTTRQPPHTHVQPCRCAIMQTCHHANVLSCICAVMHLCYHALVLSCTCTIRQMRCHANVASMHLCCHEMCYHANVLLCKCAIIWHGRCTRRFTPKMQMCYHLAWKMHRALHPKAMRHPWHL